MYPLRFHCQCEHLTHPEAPSCALWVQPLQPLPHHPTVQPSQPHRASLRFAIAASPHSGLVRQDETQPHTTPGHTRVGSWLYCFHGWSLHETVLRFGYDNKPQASSITPDKALNCRHHTNKFHSLHPKSYSPH
jgi:hypothetical protein